MKTNSISVDDDVTQQNSIGTGLYIKAAVFNHSCYPNAHWIFLGSKVEVRATRDILEQEEVVISYLIPWQYDREGAKDTLRNNYYFDCGCKLCSLPPNEDPRKQSTIKEFDNFNERISSLMNSGEYFQAPRLLTKTIEFAEKVLGEVDKQTVFLLDLLFLCTALDKAHYAALSRNRNQFSRFQNLIKKLERVVPLAFGKDHPYCDKVLSQLENPTSPLSRDNDLLSLMKMFNVT